MHPIDSEFEREMRQQKRGELVFYALAGLLFWGLVAGGMTALILWR